MSKIYFFSLFLTIFYPANCHSNCKEYIIIMKEISCPNSLSPIREPLHLEDVKLSNGDCSEDSSKILSYDEDYSNKSYLVKFDYVGFESICVPIIKSKKLLNQIKIDSEIKTNYENKDHKGDKDRIEINKTTTIENDHTKTSLLQCLIKNYKEICDKRESNQNLKVGINKTVDINLVDINKTTTNITNLMYNKTEGLLLFEQCIFTDYLCTNFKTIDYNIENNHSKSQVIISLVGHEASSVSSPINGNNMDNINCRNIIDNHKNININDVKTFTYSIIRNYACQNKSVNNLNQTLAVYNVRVHIPLYINFLNTTLQYINCTDNFKSANSTALGIECNITEALKLHVKDNYYTTTNGNNSLTDTYMFEEHFNHSLVYHCKLKKVITTKESSVTEDIFNMAKVIDFKSCTEDYKNSDKKDHLDGSQVLIISSEDYKDNFTKKEDFGTSNDSRSLKLHIIPNNVDNCSKIIPLNISKGRIIALWSADEEELINNNFNSSLFKLILTNCENYNTKFLQHDGSLELDILIIDTNNTNLNESFANNYKSILLSSKRAIINCANFSKTLQLHKMHSMMECILLKSVNNKTKVETSTSKNDSLDVHNRDINSTTDKPKKNKYDSDQESRRKRLLRNDTILVKGTDRTKLNKSRHKLVIERNKTKENNVELEMYYISPRVYILLIVSIIAVIASVLIYAFCLFKSRDNDNYQETPTRDWSAMDVTEF